jgi:hypothetical protein
MEMAIHEWLPVQMPDFYGNRIFKLKPKLDKYVIMLAHYNERTKKIQ